MEAATQTLELSLPNPNEKGFLRRQREGFAHVDKLRNSPTAADFDAIIDYILRYVSAPSDPKLAKEILLDMSKEEYYAMLNAVLQENDGPLSRLRSRSS